MPWVFCEIGAGSGAGREGVPTSRFFTLVAALCCWVTLKNGPLNDSKSSRRQKTIETSFVGERLRPRSHLMVVRCLLDAGADDARANCEGQEGSASQIWNISMHLNNCLHVYLMNKDLISLRSYSRRRMWQSGALRAPNSMALGLIASCPSVWRSIERSRRKPCF